jgi:hypothetical protein
MAQPCFIKKNSAPPECGVHKVPLVAHQSTDYLLSSKFGDFIFLVCPKSGKVLNDPATRP